MAKHRHIDIICCIITVICLVVTALFVNGADLGIAVMEKTMGYETRLFDDSVVHSIDIVMNDWEGFLATCQSETYTICDVVIDGEAVQNVAIRGKGNTSLSSVAQTGTDRYSFKIEFDQYDSANNYYGLDKLSLNNLIYDNTMMKDYLTYRLMREFGVDAPLASFVQISVNGEEWGLYLAVEGVEESFLSRTKEGDGDLYKPDSMNFGGGRGNGMDFSMEDFAESFSETMGEETVNEETTEGSQENAEKSGQESFNASFAQGFGGGFPMGNMPEGFSMEDMPQDFSFEDMPQGFDMSQVPQDAREEDASDARPRAGGGMNFGMGSSDVKLQYIDDNASSYSNIFDSAKTNVTDADQQRLIESLQQLSAGDDIASCVDIEQVMRYFVVHNFVVNGDSYTGTMVHNYYLYEEDGLLSMIPWDYNLAFGTFMGGEGSSAVNDAIDAPLSAGDDRPMFSWITEDETYLAQYHAYFDTFISEYLESGYVSDLIADTADLIVPYVQNDPTALCTYEEFLQGVETLQSFCELRGESIRAQLETGDTQSGAVLAEADDLALSQMGSMGGGMGFGDMMSRPQEDEKAESSDETSDEKAKESEGQQEPSQDMTSFMPPSGMTQGDMSQMPIGNGQQGEAFDPNQMPRGFDMSQMPQNMENPMQNMQQEGETLTQSMPQGMDAPMQRTGGGWKNLLTVCVCVLVLAGGCIFASKFRK